MNMSGRQDCVETAAAMKMQRQFHDAATAAEASMKKSSSSPGKLPSLGTSLAASSASFITDLGTLGDDPQSRPDSAAAVRLKSAAVHKSRSEVNVNRSPSTLSTKLPAMNDGLA